jgi:hypothetical protein
MSVAPPVRGRGRAASTAALGTARAS